PISRLLREINTNPLLTKNHEEGDPDRSLVAEMEIEGRKGDDTFAAPLKPRVLVLPRAVVHETCPTFCQHVAGLCLRTGVPLWIELGRRIEHRRRIALHMRRSRMIRAIQGNPATICQVISAIARKNSHERKKISVLSLTSTHEIDPRNNEKRT